MFKPFTSRISALHEVNQEVITQLELSLSGTFNTYIDYANVRPWADKLGWHVDTKRLMQFLKSFDNLGTTKFYVGQLVGDKDSEYFIKTLISENYEVRTKPVKIMSIPINASSIPKQSTSILNNFIRTALIRLYDVATIEYLNTKFEEMNKRGIYTIEDRKCNFDVEMGRDILLDHERNNVDTFVLWSGDSDFAEPVEKLLADGKKVLLFATARRVSTELNNLQEKGLFIFDIQKIKNFICWKKEIALRKSKRGPFSGAPKL